MRVLTVGLAMAVLVARPADAGRMLYATAASPKRVDGFCLRDNGSMAPKPSISIELASEQPRRLLVVGDVLYVAEKDRVEAFQIGPKGGLSLLGRTPKRDKSGPRDIAVSPAANMLYVPDRGRSRVLGHPLDADGRPATDFTTCIQGEIGASYQMLVVNGDKLYVSSNGGSGRIEVFGIAPDGRLFDKNGVFPTPSDCVSASVGVTRPDATEALSQRRQINDVKSFVIVGDVLYAEDRARRRIRGFRLTDGNFAEPTEKPNGKKQWQPAESKTNRVAQYQMIAHTGVALIGTQFFHGRIDSYELGADGLLPKKTKKRSNADLRYTPVRLLPDQQVVYVATGEFDRIIAYRLTVNGVLADRDPFSQTDEQNGSFPNDVAIAMLTEGCGS